MSLAIQFIAFCSKIVQMIAAATVLTLVIQFIALSLNLSGSWTLNHESH